MVGDVRPPVIPLPRAIPAGYHEALVIFDSEDVATMLAWRMCLRRASASLTTGL